MWYGPQASNTPAVTSVNGTQRPPSTVNFELYDVISHAHQSWPIPSGRPGEAVHDAQQKAWTYVSDRLCKCPDIRVPYSGNEDLIKQWARDLNTITNPGGQGFDDPTLAVVKTQMQVELDDVDLVAGLQLRMVNLRGLQNQTLDQALKDALKDVQNTLRVPTDKSWAGPLAGAALSATAAVAPLIIKALIGAAAASASAGPIGAAIGIVAAVIGLVIALVSNALSKTPPDKAKVSAEQLAQETTRRFVEGLNSVGQAFDLIYDDWGKLARVGEGLRSGSGWDIRQDQVGRLVSPGVRRHEAGLLPDPAPPQRRAGPVGRRALRGPEELVLHEDQRVFLVQILGLRLPDPRQRLLLSGPLDGQGLPGRLRRHGRQTAVRHLCDAVGGHEPDGRGGSVQAVSLPALRPPHSRVRPREAGRVLVRRVLSGTCPGPGGAGRPRRNPGRG